MKIAILGGGALRVLGVVNDILSRPEVFEQPQLTFMDLDVARAQTLASLSCKMPTARSNMPATHVTDDLDEALEGADFAFCYLRVGGVAALEHDKRVAAAHGFHGHDDFGPSAVLLTARTVPVVLDIARRMETLCPAAPLLIFSNPITNLVDAVTRYTNTGAIGLCSGVYNVAWDLDHLFGVGAPNPDLSYRGGGLNHLSWILPDSRIGDKLVMDMIWEAWDDLPDRAGAARCAWDLNAPLVLLDRVLPMNNGHHTHFFYHDFLAKRMADGFAAAGPDDLRSAQQDQAAAAAAALAQLPQIDNFWEQEPLKPCCTSPFGDIGVETMTAICTDSGDELPINIPNRGHIVGLPEGTVVEAFTKVGSNRMEPLGLDPIPTHHKALCCHIAAHQRLLVDAAVADDKDLLKQAMLCEPTINDIERASPMFEILWAAHAAGR
jgi:6-phospho-beta-glucosidase